MRVLVACEESQAVCIAFRQKGHEAYSCDIQECSGGHPEWHIKRDVFDIIDDEWDLMIAHPPCTHLSVSGARWFTEGKKDLSLRTESLEFVKRLMLAKIPKICIENPVSVISTYIKKPTQIIHPWQFGHPEEKTTCLWLKNLPPLKETNNVKHIFDTLPVKEKFKIWYMGSGKGKERSKTYPGIAAAMASQWGVVKIVQKELF